MIEILTMVFIAAASGGITYAVIERRRRAEHRAFLRHLEEYDTTRKYGRESQPVTWRPLSDEGDK